MSPDLLAVLTGAAIVGGTLLLTKLLEAGWRVFRWWMSQSEAAHFIGR